LEYIFFGQISPSFKRVSLGIKNPPLKRTIDSVVGKFNYTLQLNDTTDIVVVVETETEIDDVSTLLNIIRFFTQSLYDTALLLSGISCSVNFTSVYLPNKSLVQINVQDVSSWLPINIFDFHTEELFELTNNPIVRIAIADIKYACLEADLTALFSYRSIEGIMKSFCENQEEKCWFRLHENLNTTKEFIDPVTKLSKSNRHGEQLNQSFSDRQLCIHTAMIVLQRYLHYLKQGKTKLDIQRFSKIKSLDDFKNAD